MQKLNGIRNIIFDLGGVILNIDYQRSAQAFKDMGFANFDERYSQAKQSGLFDLFETGQVSEQEFLAGLNELAGIELPSELLVHAWNAMLLDFPSGRLELLKQLGERYRLFLLSNTNIIHQKAFERILHDASGHHSLDPWFEGVFFSHEIQLRKPDSAIFNHVLDRHGLSPGETLFIDDSLQHVVGAAKTGIQALWLEKGARVEDLVNPLI